MLLICYMYCMVTLFVVVFMTEESRFSLRACVRACLLACLPDCPPLLHITFALTQYISSSSIQLMSEKLQIFTATSSPLDGQKSLSSTTTTSTILKSAACSPFFDTNTNTDTGQTILHVRSRPQRLLQWQQEHCQYRFQRPWLPCRKPD